VIGRTKEKGKEKEKGELRTDSCRGLTEFVRSGGKKEKRGDRKRENRRGFPWISRPER
jgi:hypothetical protein